ncbi:EAL domain-containing protein [Ectothiorhodospiraceae bacterium WFHF3C12]|nr:EAL domain-containing protein [Ectothiorhodospiraceae bacterium WFHF3C12]
MIAAVNRSSRRQTSLVLLLSLGTLAAMALLAIGTTALVLEIQAGGRAYLIGNSLWAKAQKNAVLHLYIYADTGDPRDLERAREALEIPLADRRARHALERNPPDFAAARRHFLDGGNAPEDVTRLINVFLYFRDAPHIKEAIRIWRLADQQILRISALADELERVVEAPGEARARRDALENRLAEIDNDLNPVEAAFARELSAGAQWLAEWLFILTVAVFGLMTAIAIGIYAWLLRRIRDSERDFRATFEQAAVGMAQLDANGRFLAVNATLCDVLAMERDALLLRRPEDLLHPDDRFGDPWQLDRLLRGEVDHYTTENRYVRGDERTIWGKVTISAVRGRRRAPDRLLAVVEDVTESRRLAEALTYQASHDKLTGLFNRHDIERRLEAALTSAWEEDQRHALLFIDLDQFKVVNDTCGHVAGDHLLCQVAGLLEQQLRKADVIGRLGGDEFAVILHDASLSDAQQLAERLRGSITELAFRWEGRSFSLSISVGLVEITRDVPDVTWLLSAADTACYLAKDNGRNRVHTYVETDEAVSERRGQMEWVSDIRQAIEENRLRLFAQHIKPLGTDEGLHYELLVRLVHRDGREYSPGSFLPAAERYDLASAIDRWVVATAFEQFAAHPWHLNALEQCHINVSAQSITEVEFLRFVESKLDEDVVPGEKLCFEITETAAMTSMQEARRFIDTVQARGCAIALDDFGSGLSSFGYLKHLPVDVIKIDGIFVRDMAVDSLDRAIVESINDIGKALGKKTIAEFVETGEVADILRQVGVDYAQGYGIHRPCPLADILAAEAPRRSGRGR